MNIKRAALLMVVVVPVAWIGWAFWHAYQPAKLVLQGQIEAQQFSVASKIPGRISEVLVRRGDQVEVGQLVFTIDSPELEAKLEQAKGTEQVAGAAETAVDRGAREQEKLAAIQRERELKEQAERAEREKLEAQKRAEQAEKDAEARAKAQAEAAKRKEIEEQARREADKKHRGKINSAALKGLVDGGIDETTGRAVIVLIAEGKIPNVTIRY